MKKRLLYLVTLLVFIASGMMVLSRLGVDTAHADSFDILLNPLDSETSKYVQYDSERGAILTDEGKKFYDDDYDTRNFMLLETAPYIEEVTKSAGTVTTFGWTGSLDVATFHPLNKSMPVINVPLIQVNMGTDEGSDTIDNLLVKKHSLLDFVSKIEYDYSENPTLQMVSKYDGLMKTARSLELAGVIPIDSKIQLTLDEMADSYSSYEDDDQIETPQDYAESNEKAIDKMDRASAIENNGKSGIECLKELIDQSGKLTSEDNDKGNVDTDKSGNNDLDNKTTSQSSSTPTNVKSASNSSNIKKIVANVIKATKKVQKCQATLNHASTVLKNSKHKSKRVKKAAKQKYNKAKKALKNAKQQLKQAKNGN